MPGSKALAWAVVGLAALRRRKDTATERKARTDPFRSRPPHGAAPGTTGDTPDPGASIETGRSTNGHRPGGPGDSTGNGTGGGAGDGSGGGAPGRPGEQAAVPTQIPARGWLQVTKRAFKESSTDNVGILAGGVAYFGFLSIFPALIAGIRLYGLVADPAAIAQPGADVVAGPPAATGPLLRDPRPAIAPASGRAVGV